MKRLHAFLLGIYEFRRACTTRLEGLDATYEAGRALAHRLTSYRYED
jgi:hypothetical protein